MKDYLENVNEENARTATPDENGVYQNTGTGTAQNRAEIADVEAKRKARLEAAHAALDADKSDKSPGKKLAYHTDRSFSFGDIHEIAGRLAKKVTGGGSPSSSTNKTIDPLLAAQKRRN